MESFSHGFKLPSRKSVSPAPPNFLSMQELDSLESVLLLVEGLSLDRPVECLKQFTESVISLNIVPLLQKCLSLCHGNTRLVSNTLAVLLLTLIYMPTNITLVQDIVLGKYLEGNITFIYIYIYIKCVIKISYNIQLIIF